MKKLTVIGLVLVMCLLVLSCDKAPPLVYAPATAVTQTVGAGATATLTATATTTVTVGDTGTASGIAELEAKIRQLEAANHQLLTENQELESNLLEINSLLESVQSQIPNILIMVTQIQYDLSQTAAWLEGLPDLPPRPPGLTVSKINDIIIIAQDLRNKLRDLPDLRLLPLPPALLALDEMRHIFIAMTEWIEDLEELPEFLDKAVGLDELRYQEISHLENINAIMNNIKSILEKMRIR